MSTTPKSNTPKFRAVVADIRWIAEEIETGGPWGHILGTINHIIHPWNDSRLGALNRLFNWWRQHHPGEHKLTELDELLKLLGNCFGVSSADELPKYAKMQSATVVKRLRRYADHLEEWKGAGRAKTGSTLSTGKPAQAADARPELVTVKQKYPDPPPINEPLWVHLDWIQITAHLLQGYPRSRQNLKTLADNARALGRNPLTDEFVKSEQLIHNQLHKDIVPFFGEVHQKMTDFVTEEVEDAIGTVHAVDNNPERAIAAWKRIRLEARKQLAMIREYDAWAVVHPGEPPKWLQSGTGSASGQDNPPNGSGGLADVAKTNEGTKGTGKASKKRGPKPARDAKQDKRIWQMRQDGMSYPAIAREVYKDETKTREVGKAIDSHRKKLERKGQK